MGVRTRCGLVLGGGEGGLPRVVQEGHDPDIMIDSKEGSQARREGAGRRSRGQSSCELAMCPHVGGTGCGGGRWWVVPGVGGLAAALVLGLVPAPTAAVVQRGQGRPV